MFIRYANQSDLGFVSQDAYVAAETVTRKIDAREVVVAETDARLTGYARIEYLWSKVPYLALIRVLPDSQRQGVGRALLTFLEKELCAAGHRVLYSSSQGDEPEPQAWHRHMGFVECGYIEGVNEGGVKEVFFRKELRCC
jgi:N-acetylglutamate synthase-like GNAT family acetyltransferase